MDVKAVSERSCWEELSDERRLFPLWRWRAFFFTPWLHHKATHRGNFPAAILYLPSSSAAFCGILPKLSGFRACTVWAWVCMGVFLFSLPFEVCTIGRDVQSYIILRPFTTATIIVTIFLKEQENSKSKEINKALFSCTAPGSYI